MNCLGPLLNPLGVRQPARRRLRARRWCEPLAGALGELGARARAGRARQRRPRRDHHRGPDARGAGSRTARARASTIDPRALGLARARAGRARRRRRRGATRRSCARCSRASAAPRARHRGAERRRPRCGSRAPRADLADGLRGGARGASTRGAARREARRAGEGVPARGAGGMILDEILAHKRARAGARARAASRPPTLARARARRAPLRPRGFAARAARGAGAAHRRRDEAALALPRRDPARLRPGRLCARLRRRRAPRRSRCSPTSASSAATSACLEKVRGAVDAAAAAQGLPDRRLARSTRRALAGADAVLLIAAALAPAELAALRGARRARSGSTRWSRCTTRPSSTRRSRRAPS